MIVSSRRLRRIVVPVVLALYALPVGIEMMSGVVHGAEHLDEFARAGHERAVALGLVHAGLGVTPADRIVGGGGPDEAVVHTHGGTTHRHDGRVADLLRGVEGGAAKSAETASPPPSVAPHLAMARSVISTPPTLGAPDPYVRPDAGLPPELHLATPPPRA